jgi:outer membrane cobalamin receptor
MLIAGLLALGIPSAQADDTAAAAKKGRAARAKAVAEAKTKGQPKPSTKAGSEPRQVITGSHIPQKVKRYGRVADTVSLVYVLDRKDLERSGAANVGDALRRLPFAH